jgi:hypothetical protein
MSTSTKATYGTGSLVETATGSGVWRYRWHQDGERMRATFGTKEEPLTRKQVERAVRNREPVAPAPTATNGRTFGVVLDEWLNHGRTIRGARWHQSPKALTVEWSKSQLQLGSCSPAECLRFVDS